MRCISCNKLNYLGFLETQRASAPRCNACGGGLSEIEESHKRRTGCSYKKAEKVAAANLGAKPFICATCKIKFRSAVALGLHVKERHLDAEPVNVRQLELDYGLRKRHTT
jgi:hypothetical protein